MKSDKRSAWMVLVTVLVCLLLAWVGCSQEQEPSPGTPDAIGAFQDAAAGNPDAGIIGGDGAVLDAAVNDAMVNDGAVTDAMVNDASPADGAKTD